MRAWLAAGVGIVIGLLPSGAGAQSACDRFGEAKEAGLVRAEGLTEISGVAASTVHDGVLWAHDDSDGAPELVALGETGDDLGTYAVEGAEARDWEDLAASGGALFVGDIGDNIDGWPSVSLHRVAEPPTRPDGTGGALAAETVTLRYPDGPVNAEALLVDPRDGTLVVLTKEDGVSRVFTAPAASLVDGATVTLAAAGSFEIPEQGGFVLGLPGTAVTGADVSPDGSMVLVRTYRAVLAFTRPDGAPLAAVFGRPPCEAPQRNEAQGEAIAFVDGGAGYVTISEGPAPAINRVDPRPAAERGEDEPGDDEPGLYALAALGGVVVVLAAVVLIRARRSP